jgi:hypothetical protein
MKKRVQEIPHAVKAALVPLRRWYRAEVKTTAARLALQFRARRFDDTAQADVAEEGSRFMLLEDYCEQLPVCTSPDTARAVLASSRYADRAAFFYVEACMSHPAEGTTWQVLAAWCLARDVHDEAIANGWACSRAERSSDRPYYVDPEKMRRRRDADAARARARS